MDSTVQVKSFQSEDPRLDWVSKHDPRSLNYLVREKIGTVEKVPVAWRTGPTLNQRREGACVGFGWTAELLASPRPFYDVDVEKANQYASGYYRRCLQVDQYPGEEDNGTSVLAGAQVAEERKFIDEFRWCTGIEDVRDSVISEGPVVIGIPWYEEMYETKESGLVKVGGSIVGGHCLLVTGYHPGMRIRGEDWNKRYEVFRLRNSWGTEYGINGNSTILLEDLRDLLKTWGEACVPMNRTKVRF